VWWRPRVCDVRVLRRRDCQRLIGAFSLHPTPAVRISCVVLLVALLSQCMLLACGAQDGCVGRAVLGWVEQWAAMGRVRV